jgi:MinD superfamily P-loop ATPase
MSAVFYTIKGGVGKTTLSVQLAQMKNQYYVTNDAHASAHEFLDEERALLISSEENEIPFDDEAIYDFGGFKDIRIKPIIEKADIVCIPTLMSRVDIKACLATVKEVMEINKNILVIVNRAKSNGKAQEMQEFLEFEISRFNKDANIRFLIVREANVLEDSLFDCNAVIEKAKVNKLAAHIYRNTIKDMSDLLEMTEVK